MRWAFVLAIGSALRAAAVWWMTLTTAPPPARAPGVAEVRAAWKARQSRGLLEIGVTYSASTTVRYEEVLALQRGAGRHPAPPVPLKRRCQETEAGGQIPQARHP